MKVNLLQVSALIQSVPMNRKTQRVLKDANLILGLIDKAIKIGGMV